MDLIITKINNWKVLEEAVTYSDHRYIVYTINCDNIIKRVNEQSSNLNRAWNKKHFNNDLFEAALEWLCADEDYPEDAKAASQRIDDIMQ